MKPPKVNLLSGEYPAAHDRRPRRPWSTSIAVLFIFFSSFAFGRMTLSNDINELDAFPLFNQMRRLIGSPDRKLRGEAEDRINILLMGMGGQGHEGPNLTDTIMIASIQPSTNRVALLSIPRDLVVPLDKHGWRKINAANAFGESENPGRGGNYARELVENVFGLDIPYYVRVDFDGFRQIIDELEGVDVYVERSFSDATYPTKDYKTQTVTFEQGWQHMDGDEALKFARSRHGNAGEGSDFARAKRQQKVLMAIKDKMLSFETLKNPARVSGVLTSLRAHIATNLQVGDILRLAKFGQKIDKSAITHKIMDTGPDSPLVASNLYGAYVLVPKKEDWTDVRAVAAAIFESESDTKVNEPPPPVRKNETRAKIEIRNGTQKSGFAREAAAKLSGLGFDVVKIGNADVMNAKKTMIYDYTGGEKAAALDKLKSALAADKPSVQRQTKDGGAVGIDFLVVLGQSGTIQ